MKSFTKYITKNHLVVDLVVEILDYMRSQKDDNFELHIRPIKCKRSTAQNRLYWKVLTLMTEAAQGWGDGTFDDWCKEDFHEAMSEKYLRSVNERTGRTRTRSTTTLTVDEFTSYLEIVIKILIGTFNGVIMDKDQELYKDALGRKK